MQLRVMDEVLDMGSAGVILLAYKEDADGIVPGLKVIDAHGRFHQIDSVDNQGELLTIRVADAEAAYFERLFRDIRVDATLFTAVEDEACQSM